MNGRLLRARHELRFGTPELVAGAGLVLLLAAATFAGGVLVGRGLAPRRPPVAAGPAHEANGGAAGAGRPAAAERLTFYQTLTAPTPDLPVPPAPKIEERLLPAEPPTPAGGGRPAVGGADRRAAGEPARAEAPARPARPGAGVRAPGLRAPARPPAAVAVAPRFAEAPVWTVQVSSFRSRALAEELRARLAARGLDAYVVTVSTEEGRVRHRVRVGAFPSRGEAERVAAELRRERNLNPFVTTRNR